MVYFIVHLVACFHGALPAVSTGVQEGREYTSCERDIYCTSELHCSWVDHRTTGAVCVCVWRGREQSSSMQSQLMHVGSKEIVYRVDL